MTKNLSETQTIKIQLVETEIHQLLNVAFLATVCVTKLCFYFILLVPKGFMENATLWYLTRFAATLGVKKRVWTPNLIFQLLNWFIKLQQLIRLVRPPFMITSRKYTTGFPSKAPIESRQSAFRSDHRQVFTEWAITCEQPQIAVGAVRFPLLSMELPTHS